MTLSLYLRTALELLTDIIDRLLIKIL